VDVLGSRLSW